MSSETDARVESPSAQSGRSRYQLGGGFLRMTIVRSSTET